MPGALAQLSSFGVQDSYLYSSPQVTMFKSVYRRHTNFALEAITQTFDGGADFGRKTSVTLSRNGDLVSRIWLQVTLPDLAAFDITRSDGVAVTATSDVTVAAGVTSSVAAADLVGSSASRVWRYTDNIGTNTFAWELDGKVYSNSLMTIEFTTWPYLTAGRGQPTELVRWCNSVGHALMSSVELEIGGTRIDRHVSEFWDIWDELTEKDERRQGLWEMIGKYADATYDSTPTRQHSRARTLFIPLQFCFNRHMGLALPIIALAYHQVRLNIEFRPYTELLRATVPVQSLAAKNGGTPPAFTDVQLYAEYVFLDTPERRRFATTPHEYLFEQLQFLGDEAVQAGALNRKFQLNFNHPVKELIWVYVPKTYYDPDPQTGNQLFKYHIPGSANQEIFDTGELILNGNDRFSEMPAQYFRLLQPYHHHTRCPAKKIYTYSFALNPEDIQPSGSLNYSRVDSAQLSLKLNANVQLGRLKVFAVSYNVLRVQGGMSGLAFAS
jgi:hypothetical protein